ncbi:hypothetical protein [Clostridium lacusfryxellense]|nr:hypothetical protein [Clostridium lacusfryxellense]
MDNIVTKDKQIDMKELKPKLVFVKKSNGQLVLKLIANGKKI